MICKRHFMGRKLCELTGILSRDIYAVGIGIAIAAGVALIVSCIALVSTGRLNGRDFKQIISQCMACTCRLHRQRDSIARFNISRKRSAGYLRLTIYGTGNFHILLGVGDRQRSSLAKLCTIELFKECIHCANADDICKLFCIIPYVIQCRRRISGIYSRNRKFGSPACLDRNAGRLAEYRGFSERKCVYRKCVYRQKREHHHKCQRQT